MRYAIALALGLILCGLAQPVVAQYQLLDVMHWQFHGPVESIEERDYQFDFKANAIQTESEKGRIYHFDAKGRLKTIVEYNPYGKSTYTLGYDKTGRLQSSHRLSLSNDGTKTQEGQTCERDDQGQIKSLELEKFVPAGSYKRPQEIVSEVKDGHRLITVHKIESVSPLWQYVIDQDRMLAIHTYAGHSFPRRVTKTQQFDAKGVLQEARDFNLSRDPKKVTSSQSYKYEFDAHGNWTKRTIHRASGDLPSKIYEINTREIKYRSK